MGQVTLCNKTEDLGRISRMTEESVRAYEDMVKQIASEYRNKYKMVEREDIEQQLWLWFYEHPNNFKRYTSEYEQKESDKLIAKSLRNQAHDYCVKEKASAEGYNPNDNFWYTKDFVKMMIPGVLTDNWEKLEVALTNMGRSTKAPSESGDWMAYGADIRKAFDKLEEREQNLVFLFYAQDMDSKELHENASEDRPTAKATAMAANRALNKIVNLLGGMPPYEDVDSSE
jgi:DNA-directed RNA polymerase specialized sigma24 family protein